MAPAWVPPISTHPSDIPHCTVGPCQNIFYAILPGCDQYKCTFNICNVCACTYHFIIYIFYACFLLECPWSSSCQCISISNHHTYLRNISCLYSNIDSFLGLFPGISNNFHFVLKDNMLLFSFWHSHTEGVLQYGAFTQSAQTKLNVPGTKNSQNNSPKKTCKLTLWHATLSALH